MNPICLLQNSTPCFLAVPSPTRAAEDAFELHVTVAPLFGTELERFKSVCRTERLKALQIDFSDLTPVQIMTCSRFIGTLSDALLEVNRVRELLETSGFKVTRRKVEAAPWNSHVPQDAPENVVEYFEYHVKLLLSEKSNILRLERITGLYNAHLSSNAFKQLNDGFSLRFVTRRAYGVSQRQAQIVFDELLLHLELAGFVVQDSITEFCVFDSHLELDGAWGQ
jgi:hypothetical protein